jgi:hypothetical protein
MTDILARYQREGEMNGGTRSEFGSGERSEFGTHGREGEMGRGHVQHQHSGMVKVEGFDHFLKIVEHLVKTIALSDMHLELPLTILSLTTTAGTEANGVLAANCQNPMVPERLFLDAATPGQWFVDDIKVGSRSQYTVGATPGISTPPAVPFSRYANVTVGGRNQFTEMDVGTTFGVFATFTVPTGGSITGDTAVGSVSGPAKGVSYTR